MSAQSGPDAFTHPLTEPLPVLAHRPSVRDTFASLGTRNFRRYIVTVCAASAAAWLARLAIDWLMLELTGDVSLVAIVTVAQLIGPIALGPWGGVVGDRFSARATVVTTQVLFALTVLALAAAALLGIATVQILLLASLLIGIGSAFEAPARAVFLVEVVGTRSLPNAMGLNAAAQQGAGIVGAALTGVLVALLGVGWSLVIAAGIPFIGFGMFALIRRRDLHPAVKIPRQRGQIREAALYILRKRDIGFSILLMVTLALFGLTASVMLAWAARERFDLGAAGYSMFQTASASGAFLGSIFAARRRQLKLRDNALLLAVSGALWAITGLAPIPLLFVVLLISAQLTRFVFVIGNDALTQLSSNNAIRGRVVSLALMAATSMQVLGALLAGWAVSHLGGELAFLITGGVPVIVALSVWAVVTVRGRRAVVLTA